MVNTLAHDPADRITRYQLLAQVLESLQLSLRGPCVSDDHDQPASNVTDLADAVCLGDLGERESPVDR